MSLPNTTPNAQSGIAGPGSRDLSRTATLESGSDASPSRTLTDLHAPTKEGQLPVESTIGSAVLGNVDKETALASKAAEEAAAQVLANLPPFKKNLAFITFCLAMFIDAAGVSATFIATEPIVQDLHIKTTDAAWVLGTYSLAFASTLLFAGRIADLYSPNRVFTIGFIGIAVFYLVISFLTEQYSFFVLRALSALLAVLTIPSAINMILQMFKDPLEQAKRLGLFAMSGALANTIALVLAGAFIQASWRWYFRFITMLTAPFAVATWFILPTVPAVAGNLKGLEKWKRMDLGGVGIILAALILVILAFTQAPIQGWGSAIFIAPLVIGIVLFACFVVYEQWMPKGYTLLPHGIWSYPNIFPLMIQASAIFLWFATAQLRIATWFQTAYGDSAILAAVKLLPMGITALVVGSLTQAMPMLIVRPKYVQPVASLFCFAGSMLFAYSKGGDGNDYWRYMFPGQIIGTGGGMLVFIGMNTMIIQSFPIEYAGVGGSVANTIFQIAGVCGIAVQQGLLGTGGDPNTDWTGSRNGYFFSSGYILFTGIVFFIFYRQDRMPKREGAGAVAV